MSDDYRAFLETKIVSAPESGLCSDANAIQAFGLDVTRLHGVGQRLRSRRGPHVTAASCHPGDLALLLESAQREAVLRLRNLDPQVRQERAQAGDRSQIRSLPCVERSAALRAGHVDSEAAPKDIAKQNGNLRRDVLEPHALAEYWLRRVAPYAHRVGRALDRDETVAIDGASQVCIKKVIAHGR